MELQARVHEKQQDRIRAETEFILKYKAGQRAKQARGRATRLERYKESELVERPMELDAMDIDLPRAPELGDRAIEAHGLGKSYGARTLFAGLDVLIKPGERIGIIGPNGCGKSTLVKILLGDLEADGGEIKRAPRLRSGWFRQTHDHLDGSLTVWQYLQQAVPARSNGQKLNEQEARNLAGAFLFSGEAQEKPLGALSGGERTRAVIAGLVAGANNILVLDEPTNHLDIPSAERLEQSLAPRSEHGGYDGALLLISHDRALLETTCDRLIAFDGEGHVEFFQGRYSEWEAKRAERAKEAEARRRADADRDRRKAVPATPPAPVAATPPTKPAAATTTQAPAKPPAPKGAHSKLSDDKLNAEIAKATDRMEALDAALADPTVYRDGDKVKSLHAERALLQGRLSELEDEWLRRAS
jgi:ATP-binding cassette subfamily F protein 3